MAMRREYYFRIREKENSKDFDLKAWKAQRALKELGFRFLGSELFDPFEEDML